GFMPNYGTWVQHGEGNLDDLTRYGLGGYDATNEESTVQTQSQEVSDLRRAYSDMYSFLTQMRSGASGSGSMPDMPPPPPPPPPPLPAPTSAPSQTPAPSQSPPSQPDQTTGSPHHDDDTDYI
ncbi:hypothetical protein PIB30_089347, partial [Stylosanthes scabra]|nr:hypothetical protein [Stylosanthes scabra]